MTAIRPSFRNTLARLDREGMLLTLRKEVDARHLSALVIKADRAVLFERVRGFDIKVAGGLYWNRNRLAGVGAGHAIRRRRAIDDRTRDRPGRAGPGGGQDRSRGRSHRAADPVA